ncbi:MAG: hypothetical protein CVU13_01100 [Bacteroidetes bacterium HGW-Bacteroidetes-8]|jgi:integrase|nr:MAG: hypothetical protein CVU13_01100 [Bacteroidetes bacterium HGW-Bacteroidetes-8]
MITINFYLKSPSDKDSVINIHVYFGQPKYLKYSTSIKIPVQYWNTETQRIREVREYQEAKKINNKLNRYESIIRELSLSCDSPNPKFIRDGLDKLFRVKGPDSEIKNSFFSIFREYINRDRQKSNIKSYITSLNALTQIAPDCEIEDVNYKYLDTFKRKIESRVIERGKSKGRMPSINHVATHIKNIKAVINDARKRGHNVSDSVEDFKKSQEEYDSIYLTPEEINRIYTTTVPGSYKKTKALFIVGCYTAMRFSDYSVLTGDNIKNGLIYKVPQKTKDSVIIPMHPRVKEILEQYNYVLPTITNATLNKQIKEIAKIAEINEKVSVTRSEGKRVYVETKEKWELVTTHTARRSGATNMYLAGISPISIMKITGHKTEKAFMKYIKIPKEQNAQILANHEFFKS